MEKHNHKGDQSQISGLGRDQKIDIVDVGAESTLANAARVKKSAQQSKLLPVIKALRARKILVRWFDAPSVRDYLRITIGTDRDADALVRAVKAVIGGERVKKVKGYKRQ